MKAKHIKTGNVYSAPQILCDRVTLRSSLSGNMKKISRELFYKEYKIVKGLLKIPEKTTLEDEKAYTKQIIKEIQLEGKNRIKRAPKRSFKASEKKKPSNTMANKGGVSSDTNMEHKFYPLSQICKEVEISPAKARRILRKSNISKPGPTWEWTDPKTVEQIKELLIQGP